MADSEIELETRLARILRERFSLQQFRPGQLGVLLSLLSGKDTLAVMPTGRGKSLLYQIPALFRPGIVVVISPLISLMKDQVASLKRLGIPSGCLHSGQEVSEKLAVFSEMGRAQSFILYVSPERVQKDGFANWIRSQAISLFAIDEAHCVSQWGPEFRQDYHRLGLLRELKPDVPILGLTATATPEVLNDISRQLAMRQPDRHVYGFYRENLYCQVEPCTGDESKLEVVRTAVRGQAEGRVLIYCGTRKQCEEVSAGLAGEFSRVGFYHAGLPADERTRMQQDYSDGKIRILAATNAFGMGIDHPDVRLVVHYQMPATVESYYQEMGRAGRDGQPSTCLLLYSKKDRALHIYFIRQSEGTEINIKQRWRALDAITQFAEGGECRHAGILTYFRDTQRIQACGHCDVCLPESALRVPPPGLRTGRSSEGEGLTKTAKPKSFRKGRSGAAAEALSTALPLEGDAQLRGEVLREWRKVYAASLDIPAFLVFSNKTLHHLATSDPKSIGELQKVHGFGPQKTEVLGSFVLEQLAQCRS